jgi:Cu-Zn family superoxide dismutase
MRLAVALAAACLTLTGCGAETTEDAETTGTEPASQTAAEGPAATAADDVAEPTGTEVQAERPDRVETTVIGTDGNEIGSLSIEPLEQGGVELTLHVEGLQPGEHAVHFHSHGRCDPPDFTSAGGHYNPADARHGMPDADADMQDPDHHAGDMLNQTADDQGTIDSLIVNRSVTLRDGPNRLLDEDGTAFIIHAQPDDYESQPSGNAGPRVGCAVISEARTD